MMDSEKDKSTSPASGQSPGGHDSISDARIDRAVQTIQLPEVKDLLSESTVSFPPAPASEPSKLEPLEQQKMFKALQEIFDEAEKEQGSFAVRELRESLEDADEETRHGSRNPRTLSSVKTVVEKLWQSRSPYVAPAIEVLANASRDRECASQKAGKSCIADNPVSLVACSVWRGRSTGLLPQDNCVD